MRNDRGNTIINLIKYEGLQESTKDNSKTKTHITQKRRTTYPCHIIEKRKIKEPKQYA